MATRMELPTKREYSGEKEEQASKKAKREEEAGSVDEIMSDSFAEEEGKNTRREEEEEEEEEEKSEEELRSIFRDLEYKLFSQAYVDSDRADKISSEEDARRLFTDEEWKMFSKKKWHIQPTPGNFDNYQRLAIYTDVDDEFHWMYAGLHYPYAFDRKYLEFTQELNETIKWGTTMSGVRATAEQIWRKHILVPSLDGLGPFDTDMMIRDESNVRAISVSTAKQSAKEMVPLFLDLYKRMADGEDFVPALTTIITANGVESYPVHKASIENFLEDPGGYSNMLTTTNRCFVDYMEGARNEGYTVTEHIHRYFERNVNYGNDYIDYIKEKIRVARKLKIISTDDLVLE